MSKRKSVRFRLDRLAFGEIPYATGDETRRAPIPTWILERPDVIRALGHLATPAGRRLLQSLSDMVEIDIDEVHKGSMRTLSFDQEDESA